MTTIVRAGRRELVDKIVGFLGCVVSKCTDDRYVQASPVDFVTSSTPPVLLFSSTTEEIPLSQATEMKAKLAGAGVPVKRVVYTGTRHALWYERDALAPTLTFLVRYLARR